MSRHPAAFVCLLLISYAPCLLNLLATKATHHRPLNPRMHPYPQPPSWAHLIRTVCIWGKSARVANYICMRFVHALQSLAYKLRRKCKATTIVASVRCSTTPSPPHHQPITPLAPQLNEPRQSPWLTPLGSH